MPKSNANLALKGLDEMFSTEESRQEQKREQVQQIPIEELFPFKEHPFKVLELSGKHYLTGPVVFVRFNMEGEYVSLTMGDLHCIQEYLEQHSAALMADGKNLNCICLD